MSEIDTLEAIRGYRLLDPEIGFYLQKIYIWDLLRGRNGRWAACFGVDVDEE